MVVKYNVKTSDTYGNAQNSLQMRVDASSKVADYVYDFEDEYTNAIKEGKNTEDAYSAGFDAVSAKLGNNLSIVNSSYDSDTGIAAIAVEDSQTGETYIAYAGTNVGADGIKDARSDVNIGTNNSVELKKLGDKATQFYDETVAMGKNVTVTTGHSYGDFMASRVAIERQVPYKFGYQGAPQTASDAHGLQAELFLASEVSSAGPTALGLLTANPIMIAGGQLLKLPFMGLSQGVGFLYSTGILRNYERERVQALTENYSGYAVTFSTTKDLLTNAVWQQDSSQINYHGKEKGTGSFNGLIDFGKNYLSAGYGINVQGQYVGNVVAIDLDIPHNMTDFRKNQEAMATAQAIVAQELFGVDLDKDGQLDFMVTSDYTRSDSLLPPGAQSSDGGLTIQISPEHLGALAANLGVVLAQMGDMVTLTSQAITANEGVMETLSGRRDNLKTVIVEHLKTISLVQAVFEIDGVYDSLGEISGHLDTIKNYKIKNFTAPFDLMDYATKDFTVGKKGRAYAYGETSGKLSTVVTGATNLKTSLEAIDEYDSSNNSSSNMVVIGAKTSIGLSGESLINSFEETIEKTTQGIDNRSAKEDGIPDALNEILPVVAQNLYTVYQCIEYLISVVNTIKETMKSTDANLASGIEAFDFSQIPDVQVNVSSDYDTFLEDSEIFDDKAVMAAYDDQVDKKAESLSNEMSNSFSSWLNTAKPLLETTNTALTDSKETFPSLISQYGWDIWYTYKADVLDGKKDDYHLGAISSLISISDTIKTVQGSFESIDTKLTMATTTINTVSSQLDGFKEPFRKGMEAAFYGADNLDGIVSSQQSVATVIAAIKTRFEVFQGQLSHNKGAAINALGAKVSSTVTVLGLVNRLLVDCFGS